MNQVYIENVTMKVWFLCVVENKYFYFWCWSEIRHVFRGCQVEVLIVRVTVWKPLSAMDGYQMDHLLLILENLVYWGICWIQGGRSMGWLMCTVDLFFLHWYCKQCVQRARRVILLYSRDLDNCFQLWNNQHGMNLLEQVQMTRRAGAPLLWGQAKKIGAVWP